MANERVAVVIDVMCMEGDEYRYYVHKTESGTFIVPCVKMRGEEDFVEYPKKGWVRIHGSLAALIKADPQSVVIRQTHVSAFDLVEPEHEQGKKRFGGIAHA